MQTAPRDVQPQIEAFRAVRALAQESQQQLKSLQRELGEITVLIRQTSSEIERLTGRGADSARRLRDLEQNMDHYSRQEIREILSEAQENEMRLFVMKGQLENLEHKRRTLENMRSLLQAISDVGAAIPDSRQDTDADEGGLGSDATQGITGFEKTTVSQIIQAQEDERQRIARQLHDGPAQALTNLILRAEICERMLDLSTDQARSELASLRGMIVNTLQETREFIFDLRPMILDDLGLIPTLRRQAEIFSSRTQVPIRLNVTGVERRLPSAVEVLVFRIAQETLDNAVKHGKASEIQVSVDVTPNSIRVSIEDNGVGFDASEAMASSQTKATGLRRIQEQVTSVSGQLSLETSPGQGSKLTVQIPV